MKKGENEFDYIRCNLSMDGLIDREKNFPLDISFLFDERSQRLFLPVGEIITLSGIFQKKLSRKTGSIAVMDDCRFSTDYGNFFLGHMYWTEAEALKEHVDGDYITAMGRTYLYDHLNEPDSRFKTSIGFQLLKEL